jgi:L-amino acid N-acyltransferase YncA
MPDAITVRPAVQADAPAIAHIFNQGIEDRVATFETRTTTPEAVAEMLRAAKLVLAAEREGDVIAFGRITPYSDPHPYYAGVGEATLYVERGARRSGVGRIVMNGLAAEAQDRRLYKLVGKIFTSNAPSIALVHACGWRDVGVHLRHGKLDGEWKDVLVVELLLGDAAT